MIRYASPDLCPGCRAHLEYGATSCPQCRIPLTGPTAEQLFGTLTRADELVALLEASRTPVLIGAVGPADGRGRTAGRGATAGHGGLSAASIPKILLGLGALCLLVAALVFLAVAWAALGVGGRTGVLVVLTAVAGATSGWLARRGLRAGAESFAAVALGLLAMDLVGADNAGWLGDPSLEWFLVAAGTVVAAAGLTAGILARRSPIGTLVSAQVVAAIAWFVATLGMTYLPDLDSDTLVLVATLMSGAMAILALRTHLSWTATGAGATAGLWWLALAANGTLAAAEDPTAANVWADLAIWPALAALAIAGAVAAVRVAPRPARVVAASIAVLLGVFAATVVAYDESGTVVSLVELAVVAGCVAAGVILPGPWRWATVVPAVAAGVLLAVSAVRLAGTALETLLAYGVWSTSASHPLTPPDLPWSWPLLLPAGVAAATAAVWLTLRCLGDTLDGALAGPVAVPGATAVVVAASLVPALYGVPLGVALAAVLLADLALLTHLLVTRRPEPAIGAALLTPVVLGTALADDWLTAAVLLVASVVAGSLAWKGRETDRVAGDVVLPLSLAGLLWTALHLADVDQPWRGVVILVVLGVLMIARPAIEREVPTAVAAAVVLGAAATTPAGFDQTWLAALLTLSGALAAVSALVHPSRRRLGWVATGLFTVAQWVRLEEVGVTTVEAYTLPLACVLLVVGVVRLVRSELSSIRALGAGLSLALVPTLLHVLLDPVSARAVFLGLACLLLVTVGVAQRWSAPLLAGGAVGTLVVLREAGHAQVLPQWVVIGLVGAALTVVGVTWEQRLAELRRAGGYLRGLR